MPKKRNDDFFNKIEAIARRVGLNPNEIDDMEKFIDAVYNYVMSEKGGRTEDFKDILLEIASGSSSLSDPIRGYYLLRFLEEQSYKQGFEDGIRVASKDQTKSVRERQVKALERFVKVYEEKIIPILESFMTQLQQSFGLPLQPQQQQNTNIRIKFEE